MIKLSKKLEVENPTYPYKLANDSTIKKISSLKKIVIANTFFTLNPGIFIYLLSHYWLFSALSIILFPILAFIYFRAKTKQYSNLNEHQKFIEKLKLKNQKLLEKGYVYESSYGEYQYTNAYYNSPDYKSSSSSRSSSSSSSSSSGGRSSGGGASSNW